MKVYTAIFCTLLISSFSLYAEENDFNKICHYFQFLEKQKSVDKMSIIERNDFILGKINTNLKINSNARVAWEAISYAIGEQRYELFQYAAESVIKTKWRCNAMKKLAPVTGEF